jgi:hypothetical protein
LYKYETWSLALREDHRLKVFRNRVLRRIFELKREELTGILRKSHNEEHCNLYGIKPRRMRLTKHVARMGAIRNAYKI